jgi:hypothetical protein
MASPHDAHTLALQPTHPDPLLPRSTPCPCRYRRQDISRQHLQPRVAHLRAQMLGIGGAERSVRGEVLWKRRGYSSVWTVAEFRRKLSKTHLLKTTSYTEHPLSITHTQPLSPPTYTHTDTHTHTHITTHFANHKAGPSCGCGMAHHLVGDDSRFFNPLCGPPQ